MHVQSTFIITVTAVVTNTKHTRTRSVSLSISFLGAPAPGDEAPTARASLPRAPPRLRARAPERANTATRSQTSRATRRSMSSSHRATRRRIVIAIENSINERTKERDSRRRVTASRARRERGARGNEGAFVASRAHLMMNERAVARWRRRRVTRPAGVGNRDREGSGWLGES